MITVENQVVVSPVSFAAILDAPNSESLLRAYAEECSVPDASPQRALYAALEKAGSLQCFASYAEDNLLIGFISILTAEMPHGGRIATVESFFVDPTRRSTGAADLLLTAAEQYAGDIGCSDFVATARVGSAFEKVLSRRPGYALTHSQHTRRLA